MQGVAKPNDSSKGVFVGEKQWQEQLETASIHTQEAKKTGRNLMLRLLVRDFCNTNSTGIMYTRKGILMLMSKAT